MYSVHGNRKTILRISLYWNAVKDNVRRYTCTEICRRFYFNIFIMGVYLVAVIKVCFHLQMNVCLTTLLEAVHYTVLSEKKMKEKC